MIAVIPGGFVVAVNHGKPSGWRWHVFVQKLRSRPHELTLIDHRKAKKIGRMVFAINQNSRTVEMYLRARQRG